jgi:Fe-S cluster biogenesis protein NfuA
MNNEDEDVVLEDIQEFIQETINPSLAMHGGYITIASFDEGTKELIIVMGGGCQGCASAKETLKSMVTAYLMEEFPSITSINDVTDHSIGANPYY